MKAKHKKRKNDSTDRSIYEKYSILNYRPTGNILKLDKPCDPFDKCDPFVTISIDNEPVFTTTKFTDEDEVYIYEKYQSPKIKEDATINIQMWDSDGYGGDDLILSNTIKPTTYSNQTGRKTVQKSQVTRLKGTARKTLRQLISPWYQTHTLVEGENAVYLISMWTRCYKGHGCT